MSILSSMQGYMPLSNIIHNKVGFAGRAIASLRQNDLLVGTGVYQRLTADCPLRHWPDAGVIGKTRIVVSHTAAAAVQGLIWAPVGAGAALCSAFLFVCGHPNRGTQVLIDFYLPVTFVVGGLESAANFIAVSLFADWCRSLLVR
jgi:hypothetical protein